MDQQPYISSPTKKTSPMLFIVLGGILLVLVVVMAIVLSHHANKPKAALLPTQSISSFSYTDPLALFSLKVPNSWQLQTDIAIPQYTSEQIAFAPSDVIAKYKSSHKGDSAIEIMVVQVEKSNAKPKDFFTALGLVNPVASKDLTINTYPSYGAKVIGPAGMDDHYVITHNGNVLHFIFHQQITQGKASSDYTKYLTDYDRIATSVQFK